ncbi:hypothetical protein ABW19_dt0203713 [Dactylella cylindrospora]|nr:hypothetical protein ABW19_dt0203713 [Dactylella cylindrospora]
MAPRINISPPLLNTSSPWATTLEEIKALYELSSTGAVSTRTSFREVGFPDDPAIHQHAFIGHSSSLNSYGYSPNPLKYYLDSIESVVESSAAPQKKPFIISITGTEAEVGACISQISAWAKSLTITAYVEINLSCPNIPDKPPPAYSSVSLGRYLDVLQVIQGATEFIVPVGIKTPPYTYQNQFDELVSALTAYPGVISFITATNTLGNSLFLSNEYGELHPIINSASGTGVGGLAGESIHPLSLGNVFTIRKMLDKSEKEAIRDIFVIGVGGVNDSDGYKRMTKAGAGAVGVGTAFGKEGITIFEKILEGE